MYCVEIVQQQQQQQYASMPPSLPVYDNTSGGVGGGGMHVMSMDGEDMMLFDDIMNFSASTDNTGGSYLAVNGITVSSGGDPLAASLAASSASEPSQLNSKCFLDFLLANLR